ncbi:MAG: S-methyl-5-thioribose kinase [Devosiaceae bacterium]|nr:S-methyl-5-thioribose kinase [Devosiaceae bacterium MH13]
MAPLSTPSGYEALTVETLPQRLSALPDVVARVGPDPSSWSVKEVGDGNLNLVFIVTGPSGQLVVKQALPYVRLVGDSWPLPLKRAFFEYHVLTRQAVRDPGMVPQIYHFDETQALIVMEYLSPHIILRGKLIKGERVEGLGPALGIFCARTAFRGSDLSMTPADKKADTAFFSGNVELCDITEQLVFTDSYYEAERNHHTPELQPAVDRLRADPAVKAAAQMMLMRFTSGGETLMHGDLHTGSVMCTDTDTKVIDPEFAFYGPLGFDLGMLISNYLMAYFSQPAHRPADELESYQSWLLEVIEQTVAAFYAEFNQLWATERTGILYPPSLWEAQGQSSDGARDALLAHIWHDAMGFCGVELHRRILTLAHNADFETIEDTAARAKLEARSLDLGHTLLLHRPPDSAALIALAKAANAKDLL